MIYDRILISAETLERRIAAMGQHIASAYPNCAEVLALVLLEGARVFADRLLAELPCKPEVEYLKISSYRGGVKSTGQVDLNLPAPLCRKLDGRDILIIEDIYDTGLTLYSLAGHLWQYKPNRVKTCVLLEKQIPHQKDIAIDFLGFQVEDVFVIGYGMDYQDLYRELPFVASLHPGQAT